MRLSQRSCCSKGILCLQRPHGAPIDQSLSGSECLSKEKVRSDRGTKQVFIPDVMHN